MKHKKIGCVIMASGVSRRFGENKLLALYQGKTLIQHMLDLTAGIFNKCVVVTRCPEVKEICTKQNIEAILHTMPNRNDAVRLGIEYMADMDACMFCPCDQPLLSTESLKKMLDYFRDEGAEILRLAYKEKAGAPVLFEKKYFDELCSLPEKQGGSYLVRKYAERVRYIQAGHELELFDVDTQEDLQWLNSQKYR